MQIVLCDVCGEPLTPGALRWSCAGCTGGYCSCDACHMHLGKPKHTCGSDLVPEAVHQTKRVDALCSAKLIAIACDMFSERAFIGVRDGEQVAWLTYAALYERIEAFAFALRETGCQQGDSVVLVGHISVEYIVVTLGVFLAKCVLVPLSPSIDAESLSYIVSKVCPKVAWVDAAFLDNVAPIVEGTACAVFDISCQAAFLEQGLAAKEVSRARLIIIKL